MKGRSLFIKLLPVAILEMVLVEETALASAAIQAFESEQCIRDNGVGWLLITKGHEGIIRN